MTPNKGDQMVAERLCVVDAGTWPRLILVQFVAGHRQPGGGRRLLLLEFAIESLLNGVQREGANGRASETIVRCCEDGMKLFIIVRIPVDALCSIDG